MPLFDVTRPLCRMKLRKYDIALPLFAFQKGLCRTKEDKYVDSLALCRTMFRHYAFT
jgi:ribosomal protein S14